MDLLTIEVVGGPMTGQYKSFDALPISIGRLLNSNFPLSLDPHVSKAHCSIFQNQKKIYLIDLNSTNGTYLNGNAIKSPVLLKNDDLITVGGTAIKCKITMVNRTNVMRYNKIHNLFSNSFLLVLIKQAVLLA